MATGELISIDGSGRITIQTTHGVQKKKVGGRMNETWMADMEYSFDRMAKKDS